MRENSTVNSISVLMRTRNKSTTYCDAWFKILEKLLNISLSSSLCGFIIQHVPAATHKSFSYVSSSYKHLIQRNRLYIITQSESNHVSMKVLWGSQTQDLTIQAHITIHRLNRSRYKMRNQVSPDQLNCTLQVSQDVLLISCLTDQV